MCCPIPGRVPLPGGVHLPGGYPHPDLLGYPPSDLNRVSPLSDLARVPPLSDLAGVPALSDLAGVPPSFRTWLGTPCWTWLGYPPPPVGPGRDNLPMCGQTENITFPHPSDAVGNKKRVTIHTKVPPTLPWHFYRPHFLLMFISHSARFVLGNRKEVCNIISLKM